MTVDRVVLAGCFVGVAVMVAGFIALRRLVGPRLEATGFTDSQGARVILGAVLGFFVFAVLDWAMARPVGGVGWSASKLVTHVIAAAFLVAFVRQLTPGRDSLGLRAPPLARTAGLAALAYASFLPIVVAVHWVNQRSLPEGTDAVQQPLSELLSAPGTPQFWVLVATVVIAVPIYEETLFRGMMQNGLEAIFARSRDAASARFLAIGVASAAFSLLHEWFTLLPVFTLAVFLGWLYARSGSLRLVILVHGLHNLVVIAWETVGRRWLASLDT